MSTETPPAPRQQWWRKRWVLPTATGLAGLVIGAAAGGGGASTAQPVASPATTTVTSTATTTATGPAATATVTAKATAPTVTKTVKVTPAATSAFGEGVFIVGEDIKPGRYRTVASVTGQDCYWEIDRSAGSDDIVQNDNPAGGRPTVILRKGQQFSSERCGDWTRA